MQPQFLRDIAPYFAPSILLIFAHVLYIQTGNLALALWGMYLACPLSNYVGKQDNFNLTPKAEKAFANDKRFCIPLYVFNLFETITWVWALVLMSDEVKVDNIWF
jgi:hypothetical protein